ncbi:aminotransferase class I/II-fold pyridoxal phosphate-dependent enzyme [Boudabousia liubingyangii]|uniref:aminotransferase class I/II-fold pyridoxal phosphate-dependent enzyme n=1 Tax=Boudabousia liubingyangii TaxID=1921764 RepID=UPI0009F8D749|nr:aminotransferase class I/II-fold pyridoxal phosphate-dependent enzyme [Boudabousia liubingyangii]
MSALKTPKPSEHTPSGTEIADAPVYDTAFHDPYGRWSAKWDLARANGEPDALALNIADLEFSTPEVVKVALRKAVEDGRYSYTELFPDFYEAARNWQQQHHDWTPEADLAVFFPRIILAVAALAKYELGEGAKVVTYTPAYEPIVEVLEANGCEMEYLPLEPGEGDVYPLDFETLEAALRDADAFLLTNPHNPTGKVFNQAELEGIARVVANCPQVLVLCDDIHADFVWDQNRYQPLAKVAPELFVAGRIIQFQSPGKTFSLAGAEAAVAFTGNAQIKARLEQIKRASGIHNPNYFAIPAAIAAWTQGSPWLAHIKALIRNNLEQGAEVLNAVPGVHTYVPQGTFLQWVHVPGYETEADFQKLSRAAGIRFSNGLGFGDHPGYLRLNAAISPEVYLPAIERLAEVLKDQGQTK